MVVHTCSLIAYVGSRRWCSGGFCAREPSLRSQKSCRQVKARTSSPRPQFPSNFACRRFWLAENVSIRKLASGRTVHGRTACMWRSYVLPARRDGTGGCRDSVQKSSANEEISKLRREFSLTILGSIIASLNAVITSLARGTTPRRSTAQNTRSRIFNKIENNCRKF